MLIVLVHGIYNTSRRFRKMQAELERRGYRCLAPSLKPNSGGKGLEHLARQLQAAIALTGVDEGEGICLVGFSMGGLVARYFLQELQGWRSAKLFISLATPHHGSWWAWCLPGLGVRQMRPGSDFLRLLEQGSGRLSAVPCYSYWTPFDLVILPASSSVWAQAENIKTKVLAHPLMVRDAGVIAAILANLAAVASAD